MPRHDRQQNDSRNGQSRRQNTVRLDGRTYEVQRRERLRGRTYLLLEQLAVTPRERWLVSDLSAGGQLRAMMILPNDDSTAQHVRVLRDVEAHAVPKILDLDRGDHQTRIVVPWVKGVTVQGYLDRITRKKVEPPEPQQAIRLIHELARGLRAMHKFAHVIHGDIKPANLILTRKSSHLRMIDYGSAWPIGMTGVRSEGDGISGVFSAPELKTNMVADERADQFSTSVVLYQLLTGKVPYDELGGKAGWPQWHDPANVAVAPSRLPLSPKHLPRKLWQEIDALVLKGIDLDAGRRFSHSGQWCDATEAVFLKLRLHDKPGHQAESTWDQVCAWLGGRLSAAGEKPSE